MQAFKDQADWKHIFGSNSPLVQIKSAHPLARKSIHDKSIDSKLSAKMRKLLHEFCSETTIHGLRNIESGRFLLERLWWLTVVLVSVFCCSTLIWQVYYKWDNNPVIVSLDDTPTPVWSIPFPAITVCPQAKINREVFNFTDGFNRYFHGMEKLDSNESNRLMAALQICDEYFHGINIYLGRYSKSSLDLVAWLKNISVEGETTVIYCKKGRNICRTSFFPTLTDEGICFTFNGFSSRDMFNEDVVQDEYLTETKNAVNWTLESGYAPGTPYQTHPFRASGYATRLKLNLVSKKTDIEAHCREEQGFRMVLHSPDEYPAPYVKHLLLSLDRHINIAIRPQIMTTSKELINYPPARRQCYFNHERRLRFFRVYNQNNCELECLANYTLARCGCVKFSMPRTEETRVCSTDEMRCVIDARYRMLENLSQKRLEKNIRLSACDCMSACNSIEYLTEITHSTFDPVEMLNSRLLPMRLGQSMQEKLEVYKSCKVTVYFMGVEFVSSRRSELFGMTDFIANCGGILGLCLGISFVSVVELLYYCIGRPLMVVKPSCNVVMVQECQEERY